LAAYTEEQFLDVAVRLLPKLKDTTARMIGERVWNQMTASDDREQMGYVLKP